MAQHGFAVTIDPACSASAGALGWQRPITDPDWAIGVAGIMARVAVSVWVLWSFAFLIQRFRVALLPRPDSDVLTENKSGEPT